MSPQYIVYITIIVAFASGVGLGALTFGAYCLRGWEREIQAARREREQARKRGVYRIRNTANGSLYIGSTTRAFAARWGEHIGYLEDGKHHSATMQRDWQMYGPDAFVFEVIQVLDDEKTMRAREQELIIMMQREFPRCLIYNGGAFSRQAHPIGGAR